MHALLAAVLLLQAPTINRDAYGVPHVSGTTLAEAFYKAGYAVAEDRLWQMESSRRVARGKMGEVFGAQFAASDRERLATSYTDEEYQKQYDQLSAEGKAAFDNYAKGVNAYIDSAKAGAKLPKGYADNGFQPEQWTVVDSVAISVWLFHQFGRGGAGELRNMAMLAYLQNQPKVKDRWVDVFNDFAWQNDPSSPTTLSKGDDPLDKNPPKFYQATPDDTKAHYALLPKLNLLELLPAVRLASNTEAKIVAERMNVTYKMGSYAAVVSPKKSATGYPLLLSAPQMGFRVPSVVHEMSIEAPGMAVVGIDIPGVPGIAIGHTKDLAWGMTSGVADTDDIFYFTLAEGGYSYQGKTQPFEVIPRPLKVKGSPDAVVEQKRTVFGTVVLESRGGKAAFARRMAYAGNELRSLEALYKLYSAKSPAEIDSALSSVTMNFNLFWATSGGDIGYRYCGLVPVRADGVDPRLPTPAEAKYDWRGFVPATSMPHAINPPSGMLANWNNKPTAWWPNFDTPVWGRIFRNGELLKALDKPKLTIQDLELAAWTIARRDDSWAYMSKFTNSLPNPELAGWGGWALDGSIGATLYAAYLEALRQELFVPLIGTFMGPDNLRLIAQNSVILNALEGKTKIDYLAGRSAEQVSKDALDRAVQSLTASKGADPFGWRYVAPSISSPEGPRIPYSNRGTYIQLIELTKTIQGRNVLPPGVAESGEHSADQVPLARAWMYKPMSFGGGS